jgi:hypothetical protein
MFGAMASALPEARLESLYDAPDFGGEKTMRARVIRELIDEIRTLRLDLARASDPTEFPERK